MPYKRHMEMNGYGIVLGGGGAKGGYEIGVWKALKELNIPITAVAGTSVGALNGAIIVQDDFSTAEKLWTNMTIENVIKVEKEIAAVNEVNKSSFGIASTIRDAINSGGLDVTPLKQLLEEVINEKKVRESNIDLGIVTFSLTDFKPVRLFKNDIPQGKLIDYLLASACFPGFKSQEIGNKKFVDGGIYDNIPISLMIEKGIKDVIVIDISGPGIVRKVNQKDINTIYIKNSEDLGGTLDFNGQRSKRNMEIGYYDTLKVFGRLKGVRYYIVPQSSHDEYRDEYIKEFSINDIKKAYSFLGLDWGQKTSARNKLIVYKIMKTIKQYADDKLSSDTILPAMTEIAAEQIGIERIHSYTLNELTHEILKHYESIKLNKDFNEYVTSIRELIVSRNQLEFDREVKKVLIEGKFLIYFNPTLDENDEKIKMFRRFIAMVFPKISIANLFISLMLSTQKGIISM